LSIGYRESVIRHSSFVSQSGVLMQKNLDHLRNLVSLAYADGVLKQEEQALIRAIGSKMGLSAVCITQLIEERGRDAVTVPKAETERVLHLKDLVSMIMTDGDIDDREIGLCRSYAEKLGFQPAIVDSYVTKTREYISKGYAGNKLSQQADEVFFKTIKGA
jgi:uncharacterized tellurite resistance protein B-like protein